MLNLLANRSDNAVLRTLQRRALPSAWVHGGWTNGFNTGEGVQRPAAPIKSPLYLKDIPLSQGRDVEEILRKAILDARGPVTQGLIGPYGVVPQVQRWLYSTHNSREDDLKYQEIRNALYRGEISYLLIEAWQEAYANYINTVWSPLWQHAAVDASSLIMANLNTYQANAGFAFSPISQNIRSWIQQRGAMLVTNISEEQRKAIQSLLDYYLTQHPVSTADIGRVLRPVIGLTNSQAARLETYRIGLRTSLGMDKMEAALSSPMLNTSERTALKAKQEKALQTFYRKSESYAGMLHRQRAQVIASTEMTTAVNQGQHLTIQQAIASGYLNGYTVWKTWNTSGMENVCSECDAMDGEEVAEDDVFSSGDDTPPAHPRCCCVVTFEAKKDNEKSIVIGETEEE